MNGVHNLDSKARASRHKRVKRALEAASGEVTDLLCRA
jgi:hypothetical protein